MKQQYKVTLMGIGLGSFGCVAVVAIAAAVCALTAFVCMLLWNWVVPAVFHGPTINFWLALGLCLLLSLVASFFKTGTSTGRRE